MDINHYIYGSTIQNINNSLIVFGYQSLAASNIDNVYNFNIIKYKLMY